MRFGAAVPNCREGKVYQSGFTTPKVLSDIATTAEAEGFHSLWANDLQSTFDEALSEGADAPNFFEAQTTLAFLAARSFSACKRTVGPSGSDGPTVRCF